MVPMVSTVQKTVEIPQVQILERVVDVPVVKERMVPMASPSVGADQLLSHSQKNSGLGSCRPSKLYRNCMNLCSFDTNFEVNV